jgi:hypothetical protein
MTLPNTRLILRTLTKDLGCFVEMTLGHMNLCVLLPAARGAANQRPNNMTLEQVDLTPDSVKFEVDGS